MFNSCRVDGKWGMEEIYLFPWKERQKITINSLIRITKFLFWKGCRLRFWVLIIDWWSTPVGCFWWKHHLFLRKANLTELMFEWEEQVKDYLKAKVSFRIKFPAKINKHFFVLKIENNVLNFLSKITRIKVVFLVTEDLLVSMFFQA